MDNLAHPSRLAGLRKPYRLAVLSLAFAALTVALFLAASGAGRVAAAPFAPADPALVRCNPANPTGVVGQPFSFTIYVENVAGLYGAQAYLDFNPALVQVVDADPVATGVQIEVLQEFLPRNLILQHNADNAAGTISYAVTYLRSDPNEPAPPPVSGSGALARVTFFPSQPGTFAMPFSNTVLSDLDGFVIPSNTQDCQVTIDADASGHRPLYLPFVAAE